MIATRSYDVKASYNAILLDLYFLRSNILLLTLLLSTSFMIGVLAMAYSFKIASGQASQPPIGGAGIVVNTFPVGISLNPVTNRIYVTNEFSNTLSVINGNTDRVEHTTSLGSNPYDVDIDPYSNKIYVANLGSHSVSIIDGSTNTVVGNVGNVTSPVGIDVDPIRDWIYVTNIETNTLSKIDALTNKLMKNVTVGLNPYSVEISEGKIYVTNTGSNTVFVIDGKKTNWWSD
jgi:YVTN family beta-propeller protein